MPKSVSADALAKLLTTFQVVDVRRRPAFDVSPAMLPTATWRSPADVTQWQAELDPARPVLVYCVHDHEVSQGCAETLQVTGFDAIYLEGGFEQWVSESRTVAAKPDTRALP